MNTLITRKIVFSILMSLVLAFSVQGTADALTLTRVSDQYQSKRLGSSFEITFSVGLTSPTVAYDSERRRVSDHNDQSSPSAEIGRIDSQGYRVTYVEGTAYRNTSGSVTGFVGPRPSYATDAQGNTLPTSQQSIAAAAPFYVDTGRNVVDSQKRPVYLRTGAGVRASTGVPADPYKYERAQLDPTAPIVEADRFDFNEESISIASEPSANITITDKRDGQPAATMVETNPFAQLRTRVTLDCKVTAVGRYVITITDTTPDEDFPAGKVPTNKQSRMFTLYVTDQSPALTAGTNTITATAGITRVDTGLDKEPVSSRFTIAPPEGNVQVRYRVVEGSGTLYVGNEERTQGDPTTDLTIHQATEVWINTNKTNNKVTATLQGGDPNVNSFRASVVFEYTGTDRRTTTTSGNTSGNTGNTPQLRTPSLSISESGTGTTRSVTVTATNAQGAAVPGLAVTLSGTALSAPQSVVSGTPTTITIPSTPGTYTLQAVAAGYTVGTRSLTVAAPLAPGTLTITTVGARVGNQQGVRITAQRGGSPPSSALTVSLSGITLPPTVTIPAGQSSTVFTATLPSATAATILTASATGYNPVTFTIPAPGQQTTTPGTTTPTPTGPAGAADSIEIDGSRQLSRNVNQATPLRVRVVDANDRGVSDVRVTFRILAPGQGRLSQRGNGRAVAVETDRNGYASASLTPLGGDVIVEAKAAGVSASVTFIIDVEGTTDAASTPRETSTAPTPRTTISPVVHVGAANRPPMLWVDGGAIYALVGADVQRFAPSVDNALNIAVGGGKVYWTEATGESGGTVNSANLNGSGVTELASIFATPMGIAVDTAGSKLYWTNSAGRIQSANLDGSRITNVLQNLPGPKDITISRGNLYWTQYDATAGAGSVGIANSTGRGTPKYISTGSDTPGSLAINSNKVYWTEMTGTNSGTINSANLAGTGAAELASIRAAPSGIAVDNARSKLLWTNSRGRIQSANLDGSRIQNVVDGLGSPGDMVLSNSITVPAATTTTTTTTTADTAKYDVNGDGKVDNTDASLVAAAMNTSNAQYDVNGDGTVNFLDLLLVFDNRDAGAASAPTVLGMQLSAVQRDVLQEQIDLLIATGDRSPAAMRTLIYLQQLIATARPEQTQLLANYPNPFNPETWIPYELATDTEVRLTIYNTHGVVIRTLQLGHQSAGYYVGRDRAAYWDGRNAYGEQVASGIYFYQLETDDLSTLRKMVILK